MTNKNLEKHVEGRREFLRRFLTPKGLYSSLKEAYTSVAKEADKYQEQSKD